MALKHNKSCLILLLVIRENKNRITKWYHYLPTKMAEIKKTDDTKYWKDIQQLEFPYTAGRSLIWYKHSRNLSVSTKTKCIKILWRRNSILFYISSKMHLFFHLKEMYKNVHSNFAINSSKLETAKWTDSINRG